MAGTYIGHQKIGKSKSRQIVAGEHIGITAPATKMSYKLELVNSKNDSDTTELM